MNDLTPWAPRASKQQPAQRPVATVVRARFDNAETTDENRNHWANASALSPNSLAVEIVRHRLANRCRYECRNNSWAKGIRDTLANDTIGTGPRLQMLTDNEDLNDIVEADFTDWAQEIGLAEKLRVMRAARIESGEVFGLMGTNPALANDVKLDVELAETEQVTDPIYFPISERRHEGIEYDEFGNAVRYHVMKFHPGSTAGLAIYRPDEFRTWPAKYVLHYFRPDRPGQSRGIPDLTPAIDQFAELRRYAKAVLAAAESAADHALVVYTDAPPDPDAAQGFTEFDTFELKRRLATTLPQGWKLGQVEAEQPTTTYDGFVKSKLAEIARCLNVPLLVAGLDARDANMSSAYVVGQKYERTIEVDRSELVRLLNRLFDLWLTEWIKTTDAINAIRMAVLQLKQFRHVWQWDEVGNHADPNKVASARQIAIASGVSTRTRECARQGLDIQDEDAKAAKEWGVSIEEYRKALFNKTFGPPPAQPPLPEQPNGAPARTESDDADE